MKLEPKISGHPPEIALSGALKRQLDKTASASGFGEAFVQGALSEVCDMLLNCPHDVIETVATVAPRTGHLIISFRVCDSLGSALARAADNGVFRTTH